MPYAPPQSLPQTPADLRHGTHRVHESVQRQNHYVFSDTKFYFRTEDMMQNKDILSHIDHTLLKPFATWQDIQTICDDAVAYQTASVCIPPSFIQRVKETYGDTVNICTVVGFPLGYMTTDAKVFEAKDAVDKGANEVDMVINIGMLKEGRDDELTDEIRRMKEAVGPHILKVIVETCFLTQDEKVRVCKIVTNAGADFIKTSTGFGTGGATREDVQLFAENIGPNVKIKAAGGVKTREDLEDFLALGCQRIGTSGAVAILKNDAAHEGY